jgi:hypothetical protein
MAIARCTNIHHPEPGMPESSMPTRLSRCPLGTLRRPPFAEEKIARAPRAYGLQSLSAPIISVACGFSVSAPVPRKSACWTS